MFVHVVAGIDLIVSQLGVLKGEVNLVKEKVYKTDLVKKWVTDTAKDTSQLSESQIDRVENVYTVSSFGFGCLAWGSLVVFGAITVIENEVPVSDFFYLLNSVRVQALRRGIDHYTNKKSRVQKEKAKVEKAAAVKAAAKEAVAEKKAKEAEADLRMAKVQQARAERKAKFGQADAVRNAKAKEAHAVRLAEWKKENAVRKEAAVAMKAKIAQAAAVIKVKEDRAIAARGKAAGCRCGRCEEERWPRRRLQGVTAFAI